MLPPLTGGTEWLNSEPLGPADLRGHVVLVNFWTFTCINWLRQEPYVRAWSHAYRDDGLRSSSVDGRLHQLIRQVDEVGERTLQIMFLEPGAEAYVFTFG